MIKLTRFDSTVMYLNQDLIEVIEEVPETHITLTNGNRYLVLESTRTIIDKIISFKASIMRRSSFQHGKRYLPRHTRDGGTPFCVLDRD